MTTNDPTTQERIAPPATGWLVLPTAARAAAHATPFPDFDPDGDWVPKAAVHDLAVAQMVRLAEQEADE